VFIESLSDQEVCDELRAAGLYVHASTHLDYLNRYYAKPELLGLAPLEALACGTPTLVSKAGSLGELTSVDGCWSFETDNELASFLENMKEDGLNSPTSDQIARSTEQLYGLRPFGHTVLSALDI
jgi:glycosyltransferase involved in cell wall biosynthesis